MSSAGAPSGRGGRLRRSSDAPCPEGRRSGGRCSSSGSGARATPPLCDPANGSRLKENRRPARPPGHPRARVPGRGSAASTTSARPRAPGQPPHGRQLLPRADGRVAAAALFAECRRHERNAGPLLAVPASGAGGRATLVGRVREDAEDDALVGQSRYPPDRPVTLILSCVRRYCRRRPRTEILLPAEKRSASASRMRRFISTTSAG